MLSIKLKFIFLIYLNSYISQKNKTMKFNNYSIKQKLYESKNSLVFRAIRDEDSSPVILKYLKNSSTNKGIFEYNKEYNIVKKFNCEEVIKVFNLEVNQTGILLVFEDFGGESLSRLDIAGKLNIQEYLTIAIKITNSIIQIHKAGIIHKDINPNNIVFNPNTKDLKIIDFSISSQLSYESYDFQAEQNLQGTLPYISPEQTGRMNRFVDYRSDFYSLGITLYELITGRLPFTGKDTLEILHAHIAKQPCKPSEFADKNIPEVVSDIIMILIAKNAEQRYQSGYGILKDLQTCYESLQSQRIVSYFPLKKEDFNGRFNTPQKLYGREKEVKKLLNKFDRTIEGGNELILVAGYSGVGKSALVNEVQKSITAKRSNFIKGKFDQYQRNIPFYAITQAFNQFCTQLLCKEEIELDYWRYLFSEAVGVNGQVLIDVIPMLEEIIGPQPDVPKLDIKSAKNRFNLIFYNFVKSICKPEHPLVIFIDDVQWADLSSLDLLKIITNDLEIGYIFIIAAYRNNEVDNYHPLSIFIEKRQTEGKFTDIININNLEFEQVNLLIAESLQTTSDQIISLSQEVYQKTQGNPFFVKVFLNTLYQKKLILFDHENLQWKWNILKIKQQNITDNVVNLMVFKINSLSLTTKNILQVGACVGNEFSLEILILILKTNLAEIKQALFSAVQEGLIYPCEFINFSLYIDNEQSWEKNIFFRFVHDRIQQAAYSIISDEQKQIYHWEIGQVILQNNPPPKQGEYIFDIVNQLNLGTQLIQDPSEKINLASLNYTAAIKAISTAAYSLANNYLKKGRELLPKNPWLSHYELTFNLYKEESRMEYLLGNFDKAEAIYDLLLTKAQNLFEKIEIYQIQMTQYQLQGRYEEAIKVQYQCLNLLDQKVPTDPSKLLDVLNTQITSVSKYLGKRSIEDLEFAEAVTSPQIQASLEILQSMFYTAYLHGNQTLANLSLVKMTTLSLQYGNSSFSPFGYVGYGLVLGSVFGDYSTGYRYGKMGVQLSEHFTNLTIKSQANFLFAADVHNWSQPIRFVDKYYENAYKYGLESGDWVTIGYMIIQSCSDEFTRGDYLNSILKRCKKYLSFLQRVKNQDIIDLLYAGVINPILQLRNNNSEFENFDEAIYLEKYAKLPYYLAWHYYAKFQQAFLFDEREQWSDLITKLNIVETYVPSHSKVPATTFYAALMLLNLENLNTFEKRSLLKLENKLKLWMEACPENISHKYWLIQAEKARVNKDYYQAMEYYDKAIQEAWDQKFIHIAGLANELAARFYQNWNKPKIAKVYIQEAYHCYSLWGAQLKITDLENRYSQLLVDSYSISSSTSSLNSTISIDTETRLSETLDFNSILKASSSIFQCIHLESLLINMMQIIIENAGAEVGILWLMKNNNLSLAASGNTSKFDIYWHQITDKVNKNDEADKIYFPQSVINLVHRTKNFIISNNAYQEEEFANDPYIQKYSVQSIICIPLLNQGKIRGIIYLENKLVEGAFTPERVQILKILSSQSVIALENAQLYETLEEKVLERTQELSQTLEFLKNTQNQLVEAEKMAALGNLVAGVAHEINTPLGNSITATSVLVDETELFVNDMNNQEISSMDLEDFVETVATSSKIILRNLQRAGDLISSFKQVAVDQTTSEKRRFAIKPYINEVLLSLNPKIKNTGHKIILSGSDEITIDNHPGAIAQVINNLVLNSLTHAYPSGEKGTLHCRVSQNEQEVVIEYSDDGCGIPPENLDKVLEPFFTTARNKGGTGLGLHIVYNLVYQKLGGKMKLDSQVSLGTTITITIPNQ